jgi:hypothetical protein
MNSWVIATTTFDCTPAPILANGMVVAGFHIWMGLTLLGTFGLSLLILVPSLIRRTRKWMRGAVMFSVVLSIVAPLAVPIVHAKTFSVHPSLWKSMVYFLGSALLPLAMSAAAVYFSRKDGRDKPE